MFEQGVLIVATGYAYETLAVSTSAVGLAAIPANRLIRRVVIQVLDGDVRWMAVPSTNPTSTTGLRLRDGDTLVYDGVPEDIKFIKDDASTGDPVLGIHYFGA